MGFRFRLASFFVAVLVLVQGATALLVYQVARHELIGEGQRQLGAAAGTFVRQLDGISGRVADSVQVLALDFALRSAIAQHDEATLLSALRNHGRRVGAAQMLLVDVEGRIEADTRDKFAVGALFPYRDLVERALGGPTAAIVASDGRAYWMVVVPVFAPNLVGFIAAAIPVDDRLLAQLQQQSSLPGNIELASRGSNGQWRVLAHGATRAMLTPAVTATGRSLPMTPQLARVAAREFVVQGVRLDHSAQSAPVVALLGYSVDEALRPYRTVTAAWAALSALGLLVGLVGAWLIARSVSRPVERLAASARRIQAGDYTPATGLIETRSGRRDELGQLAAAFANMTQSIRDREARILHQARHDQVTGLPNRMASEEAIDQQLAAHRGTSAALLMIGLGNVSDIIKTMGHEVCDRVMRDAGARLQTRGGAGVIARATDNEFAVFLPAVARDTAIATAFRLVEVLSEPHREAEASLDLAPAVGIALAPVHGDTAGILLRRAEVALIAALGAEDPVAVYDPATDPHRPERLSLMGDLRESLEQDRVDMHFQPKLDLGSSVVDSAEGLVRWRHPRLGPIAPDAFIPLAEESGNIRRLTRWALATGIAQAGRWAAAGHALRVSINVSARDLDDSQLPRRIAELLAIHEVPAHRIALEITESAIMGKPDAAMQTLERITALGVVLSIDDFGVGQSSFAYLRRLPVQELKIDKSFITHVHDSRQDQAIVRTIVDLGHDLGCTVTAEGVESQAALDYLRRIGCDHAQGYFIAHPMPAEAFMQFLVADARSSADAGIGTS